MVYDNTEFYVQDNWKVNNQLTVDYGIRFTRQQPQHDRFQQMSNFFPDSGRPRRRRSCISPAAATGRQRAPEYAKRDGPPHRPDPDGPGLPTRRPRSARRFRAPATAEWHPARRETALPKTGYIWPKLVVGPRFGMAYDLTGTSSDPARRRRVYYDRPDGNTVFSIPGNPPLATARDLRNGQLQTLAAGPAARFPCRR